MDWKKHLAQLQRGLQEAPVDVPGVPSFLSLAEGHGLLGAPRHFNVALTRAQSLTVVVGNPHVLRMDPWWSRYLKQCETLGTFIGVRPLVLERDKGDGEQIVQEPLEAATAEQLLTASRQEALDQLFDAPALGEGYGDDSVFVG